MRRSLTIKIGAAVVGFGLIGAACGGTSDTSATGGGAAGGGKKMGGATAAAASTADISTGAPQLVQGLTDLLDSHVYLASVTVVAAKAYGLDSPQFKAAAATLDQNSQDLAGAVGSVYGDAAGKQFLALWRKHIGFFVEYAKGLATNDKALVDKAQSELDQYRAQFGAFIDSATNGGLSKGAVEQALAMHVKTLEAAIDAVMTGKGDPFTALYTAAHEHMPETASALAGAIVQQYPDKFAG